MAHFMEYFGGLRENAPRSLHKVFGDRCQRKAQFLKKRNGIE